MNRSHIDIPNIPKGGGQNTDGLLENIQAIKELLLEIKNLNNNLHSVIELYQGLDPLLRSNVDGIISRFDDLKNEIVSKVEEVGENLPVVVDISYEDYQNLEAKKDEFLKEYMKCNADQYQALLKLINKEKTEETDRLSECYSRIKNYTNAVCLAGFSYWFCLSIFIWGVISIVALAALITAYIYGN